MAGRVPTAIGASLMIRSIAAVLAAVCLAMSALPVQAENLEKLRVNALEGAFAEQKAAILEGLGSGKYAKMEAREAAEVRTELARIERLLDGVNDAADMTPEGRVQLMNAQGLINTLLTKSEYDQMQVCRRQTTVGSNFRHTICETVAERRARRERDQEELHRFRHLQPGFDPTEGNICPTCPNRGF
jgi:hypothetical protein